MKLIVHVGAHKTATTHLQLRLRRARPALSALGAAYIGPDRTRGDVDLSGLLTGTPLPQDVALWRGAVDAAEAAGHGRLILSEENLIGVMAPGILADADGRLYPQAGPRLARLFGLLGRQPTSIALAVREPAAFLTSAFGMWMAAGHGVLFDDFIRGTDPRALSWTDLARRIIEATGTPRLSVWRYEDYGRKRNQVLARLLGPDRVPVVPGVPPQLVGWSQAAYRKLLDDLAAHRGPGDLAEMARAARAALPRSEGRAGLQVIAPVIREATAAAYVRDWATLRALRGVRPVR